MYVYKVLITFEYKIKFIKSCLFPKLLDMPYSSICRTTDLTIRSNYIIISKRGRV